MSRSTPPPRLVACPACARHVRAAERACPFCDAAIACAPRVVSLRGAAAERVLGVLFAALGASLAPREGAAQRAPRATPTVQIPPGYLTGETITPAQLAAGNTPPSAAPAYGAPPPNPDNLRGPTPPLGTLVPRPAPTAQPAPARRRTPPRQPTPPRRRPPIRVVRPLYGVPNLKPVLDGTALDVRRVDGDPPDETP